MTISVLDRVDGAAELDTLGLELSAWAISTTPLAEGPTSGRGDCRAG